MRIPEVIADSALRGADSINEVERRATRTLARTFEVIFAAAAVYSVYRLGGHVLELETITPIAIHNNGVLSRAVETYLNTRFANVVLGSDIAAGAVATTAVLTMHEVADRLSDEYSAPQGITK